MEPGVRRIKRKVNRLLGQRRVLVMSGLVTAILILLIRLLGILQFWELQAFDRLLQLRPPEAIDQRIVIVTVGEAEMQQLGQSLISDQVMADLLTRIKAQQPQVIGLDFYRNLPTDPGYAALVKVLQTTPNLIGITKVIGDDKLPAIPGNAILAKAGQVAASDVVIDLDGRVRRGLLVPNPDAKSPIAGLSFQLALRYLEGQGIQPDATSMLLRLRGVQFVNFAANDGGYVGSDAGGYQILLNPRGPAGSFQMIAARDLLAGKTPPQALKGKIVVVGSTLGGQADAFLTAYSSFSGNSPTIMYGVELQAHFTSQIISAVLDRRPLIQVLPDWAEGLVVLLLAGLASWINGQGSAYWRKSLLTLAMMAALLAISFGALLHGWWLPVVPGMIAILTGSIIMLTHSAQKLKTLSTRDDLTQLANRRVFSEYLDREWYRAMRWQAPLSLILGDVDHFKAYNDSYGHLEGDECLFQVARAIEQSVKRSSDLVARYGGEEFIVLLPNTDTNGAINVAKTIQTNLAAMNLPHRGSPVAKVVTLSMGVVSLVPRREMKPTDAINEADSALYVAKASGRNQFVLQVSQGPE
jgi:adenylate cyclase